jgi:hypothetical protein
MGIEALCVPEFLNTTKIVDKIFGKTLEACSFPPHFFKEIRFPLLLLASMVNGMPVLGECINIAIRTFSEWYPEDKGDPNKFLPYLLEKVKDEWESHSGDFIPPTAIYPLIYNDGINVLKPEYDSSDTIEDSVYLNQITEFHSVDESGLVSRGSIVVVKSAFPELETIFSLPLQSVKEGRVRRYLKKIFSLWMAVN